MDHVVDQAVTILKHRKVSGLFTTPKLLEALGEKINLWEAGIRGVFCGGTTMAPQYVRFIVEEVLENRIGFYPTYGNTLMGLAASVPLRPEDNFSVTYYAPQPRAVLRVVDPAGHQPSRRHTAQWGRVELTTLTQRIFHAAISGARRSPPPRTARALRLGRRGRSAPLRRDGEEHRRRRVLASPPCPPHSSAAPRPPVRKPRKVEVADCRTGDILATVSQVNAGIIRKDLARSPNPAPR